MTSKIPDYLLLRFRDVVWLFAFTQEVAIIRCCELTAKLLHNKKKHEIKKLVFVNKKQPLKRARSFTTLFSIHLNNLKTVDFLRISKTETGHIQHIKRDDTISPRSIEVTPTSHFLVGDK